MRKLIFALAVLVMGGFAVASGSTPASAMSAGALTTMADVVNSGNSTVEKVAWVRRCWWRYGRRHCRSFWRPGPRWGYGRRCWWRHGRRVCRY